MMVDMIAHLEGTVVAKKPAFLIVATHGVGYKVYCTNATLDKVGVGANVALYTHLAVREDALDLFGFVTYPELELFQLLIGISGIGPRSALGVMGLETVEKLAGAIAHGDVAYLTKVSGVGKKSAEKIVLELKDKVSLLDISDIEIPHHPNEDVLEALKALGYRESDARTALRSIPDTIIDQSAQIREALRILSRS